MLRLYLLIFILGILGSTVYGAYWYYTDTQNRMVILRENNVKLEQAADTLQQTVDIMQIDAERNAQLNKELTTSLQKAEQGLDGLRKRLSQIDLTQEALNDPGDLESRINRAVERLINDIKNDTSITSGDTVDVQP
jgi:predicted nucleic acid-binding protein